MADNAGLEAAIEEERQAVAAVIKGDPEPFFRLYSPRDDATLANPFGPPMRGMEDIREQVTGAAANYRDGEVIDFEPVVEVVTPELAYIVKLERFRVKLDGSDELTPVSLRVTSIFRPEEGIWKLVHRHADPITTPRGVDSVAPQ